MDDRVRISIELDQAEHDALASIADGSDRTVSDLIADAARGRIEIEREWEEAVHKGLEDIKAGRTISHEDYVARAAERRRRWLADRAA